MENVIESRHAFENLRPQEALDGWAIRNVDLQGADFGGRLLQSTSITKVGLLRSRLDNCAIRSSTFQATAMRGVGLQRARLSEVAFVNCEMIEADLSDASVCRLEAFDTRMTNVRFVDARILVGNFQNCDLYGANFSAATLMRVRHEDKSGNSPEMSNARFDGAVLMDVSFRNANLFRASFRNALLLRVNFRGANLVEADFRGAVHIETDWSLTDLDRAKFG